MTNIHSKKAQEIADEYSSKAKFLLLPESTNPEVLELIKRMNTGHVGFAEPSIDNDIVQARLAIQAIDPDTAQVTYAVRGFDISGIPTSPLYARLEDGTEWVIEEGLARKLTEDEINKRNAAYKALTFGDID